MRRNAQISPVLADPLFTDGYAAHTGVAVLQKVSGVLQSISASLLSEHMQIPWPKPHNPFPTDPTGTGFIYASLKGCAA